MSDQEQMKTDLENTNDIDTSGDKDGADSAGGNDIVELVLGDDGVYYDSDDNVYKIVEAFSD